MNCIVVDDNEVIRKQISAFIRKSGFLSCFGEFENPVGIESCIDENDVSLIFLDIEMPLMSGFDFLDKLGKDVQIIVISASRKYALEAYDYNITDYLLKPISYERFIAASSKAVERHIASKKSHRDLYFKINDTFTRVQTCDIFYGRLLGDKFEITLDNRSLIVDGVICDYLLHNCDSFVKVKDDCIVNASKVSHLSDDGKLCFNDEFCVADDIIVEDKFVLELQNHLS